MNVLKQIESETSKFISERQCEKLLVLFFQLQTGSILSKNLSILSQLKPKHLPPEGPNLAI